MKPLTPNEVILKANKEIPDFIILAFNNLLVKNYKGGSVHIEQDDILAEIRKLNPSIVDNAIIFENGWLNVESLFEQSGWKVEYVKPSYCDIFKAYFKFIKL